MATCVCSEEQLWAILDADSLKTIGGGVEDYHDLSRAKINMKNLLKSSQAYGILHSWCYLVDTQDALE